MKKFTDLTGQKFGKLTVISVYDKNFSRNQDVKYNCKCDCGRERIIKYSYLVYASIKNCGFCTLKKTNKEDLTGQNFGFLTCISLIKFALWNCQCICGKYIERSACHLKNGTSTHCGCKKSEKSSISNSLPNDEGFKKRIYNRYEKQAKKRNLDFNLSLDELLNLIYQNCFYCGAEPVKCCYKTVIKDFKINSIDRKDNNIDYTIENCVACCKICNRGKNNIKYDEFVNWLENITKYRNNL